MKSPEFETPIERPELVDPDANYDDTPDENESSLHTITIGQQRIGEIGYALNDRLSKLEIQQETIKGCFNKNPSYWGIRVNEIEHEIEGVQALIKMILGAESIDIHHHVNPLKENK